MAATRTRIPPALVAALGAPFYVAYGALVVVRAGRSAIRRAKGYRLALGDNISCPHGHRNATQGRWECLSCKGVYLGWCGSCTVCGAGASYISCAVCGVSILLPWERA